jgi:hypothetical protein
MNAESILNTLEIIQKDLADIKQLLCRLPSRRIPGPPGYNPMGKKKCFSQKLRGGLKDPLIRATIMKLRKEGERFEDIAVHIREQWPNNPEKHTSRSAIHRFYQAARAGRLEEYGIKRTIA